MILILPFGKIYKCGNLYTWYKSTLYWNLEECFKDMGITIIIQEQCFVGSGYELFFFQNETDELAMLSIYGES